MPRLASAAVAAALCLALGACSDAADTPEQDAVAQSSDAPSSDSTTPPSKPTDLFIARVTKSAPAKADGCLNSVRTGWEPDSAAKTQRLCGVQSNEETWFSVDPATAFGATVTEASASVLETDGSWAVTVTLDDKSAQRFGQLTTKLLSMPSPDPLALIVRGRVVSAPIPTPGLENLTTLQLAGDFSRDEAEGIATALGAQ